MSATLDEIRTAVERALDEAPERNFVESVDLHIALKDVDLKDPSNRFRAEVLLPNKLNKTVNIAVIGDAAVISNAKEAGVEYTFTMDDVERMAREPDEALEIIEKVDYFLALPQMMADIGRLLGRYLGPRGKMPSVIPPGSNIEDFVTRYGRTARIRLRQNPVVHVRVATVDMAMDDIVANARAIITEVENRLQLGFNSIKHSHIKTTMGPPQKVGA